MQTKAIHLLVFRMWSTYSCKIKLIKTCPLYEIEVQKIFVIIWFAHGRIQGREKFTSAGWKFKICGTRHADRTKWTLFSYSYMISSRNYCYWLLQYFIKQYHNTNNSCEFQWKYYQIYWRPKNTIVTLVTIVNLMSLLNCTLNCEETTVTSVFNASSEISLALIIVPYNFLC